MRALVRTERGQPIQLQGVPTGRAPTAGDATLRGIRILTVPNPSSNDRRQRQDVALKANGPGSDEG
jgi:hypothetical protein